MQGAVRQAKVAGSWRHVCAYVVTAQAVGVVPRDVGRSGSVAAADLAADLAAAVPPTYS